MSKNHDSKKDSKKKPAKTIMEKRAAKREKRHDNASGNLFDQPRNVPGSKSGASPGTPQPKGRR